LAAAALQDLKLLARAHRLAWLDIAMSAGNVASIRTAEAAGAVFEEEFVALEQGGARARRYRLYLRDA
jgi:predicted acetyltransferase